MQALKFIVVCFMQNIVIMGGGPAGAQCALWLYQLGLKPIIVEKSDRLGGLQAINPYLNTWVAGITATSGEMIATKIHQHIQSLPIPVFLNQNIKTIQYVKNNFIVETEQESFNAEKLVIATGVSPRNGELKNAPNVLIGPGKKIADFNFKGKKVAILGGGDNAAENYSFIMSKQPALCHVYARTIRARNNLISKIVPQNIFVGKYVVDQTAMAITYQTVKKSYDVFVVLYGWQANIPKALDSIKNDFLDKNGFIKTNEKCQTKIPNLYAIGEVTQRNHPCVVTSLADGVIAAKAIESD